MVYSIFSRSFSSSASSTSTMTSTLLSLLSKSSKYTTTTISTTSSVSYSRTVRSRYTPFVTATIALRLFSMSTATAAPTSDASAASSNKKPKISVPASLAEAKPIRSLVPPGTCQFTEEFASVPLLERTAVSSTSTVLKFGVPDSSKPLNLSTCACILAKADISYTKEGETEVTKETVIRPYTPISTNAMVGSFDLLIKDYGKGMSQHMCQTMKIGDTVDFKHIPFNVKIQAPFPKKHIVMIAGGTGITPMIQALHAILGEDTSEKAECDAKPDAVEKVTLLYGSRVSTDVLGKELLEAWASQYSSKFKVVHVLSHEPKDEKKEDSSSAIEYGFIDQPLMERHVLGDDASKDDIMVFVCGPPPMYNALCGPRDTKELSGLLATMGFSAEQVYKF